MAVDRVLDATPTTTSVIGKCRFCEHAIVVEQAKATGEWIVRSSPPI